MNTKDSLKATNIWSKQRDNVMIVATTTSKTFILGEQQNIVEKMREKA